MFGFEKDGKYGYMDKNEKVVIPAIYDFTDDKLKIIPKFIRGHVLLKKDGKSGIMDKTGKVMHEVSTDVPPKSGAIATWRKYGHR